MNVIWLPGAVEDIERIVEQRAQHSSDAAHRFANRVVRRSEQLASFPMSGRVVPEFELDRVRELLEDGFRILYEVFPDRVEVFAVAHSRQDLALD